ncbi:four helix bundle protein [Algisphaera agarilytica]|uniref:Four helix bundle protein n=1 Tax=Algisphaera agarilytica TaxID=1385975 RepID=A0A7X0H662_9BACT|nr:four helix bundle protein [Algisphaera agarilytica]MBB6429964.1 four helix bundle protein [Algisphaera agarilytica]
MTPDELELRSKSFAIRVVKLVDALPQSAAGRTFGKQLIRSASSVAANYRAVRRGRSTKEFLSKLSNVVKEADESAFWLEMIIEAKLLPEPRVCGLLQEANELTKIFAASRKTASRPKSPNR